MSNWQFWVGITLAILAFSSETWGYTFSQRSLTQLEGVHPDLVRVAHRALELTKVDFVVIEGMRTLERQKKLYAAGASQTLRSKHLTGHAIDVAALVDGKVSWNLEHYAIIAHAFKQAAAELGVAIVWGGDWSTFIDGPHFEILPQLRD